MSELEISVGSQTFATSLSGVTQSNGDGVSRQRLLSKISKGSTVKLRREPDNPHDKYAIAVVNSKNQTIGFIPAGDRRLAEHLDRGGAIQSRVVRITGGPNIFEKIFGKVGKSYGCVVEITKGNFDWKSAEPWMSADRKICDLIKAAKKVEESNPKKAIDGYIKAINGIAELDSNGSAASAWRTAPYPINRLSLLLDKSGLQSEAINEIERWKKYPDRHGISDADLKAVESRLARLQRKIT